MKSMIAALFIVAAVLTVQPLSGQTFGVSCMNDYFVAPPGALTGPPFGIPCPVPVAPPAGAFISLCVTTIAPGMPVFIFIDTAGPCCPGFFCLPFVGVPYAIPPCLLPCGFFGTNQSVDLCSPAVLLSGFSGPKPPPFPGGPPAPGGLYCTPPFVAPVPPLGIVIGTQAAIIDPTAPLGIVLTNAFDLIL